MVGDMLAEQVSPAFLGEVEKIRTAAKEKAPFVLIAGGEDREANAVSFRFRDGTQDNGVPVEEAIERGEAKAESDR